MREVDKSERGIFAGQEVKYYTGYKPSCGNCGGYRKGCEESGLYFPKIQMSKMKSNLLNRINRL